MLVSVLVGEIVNSVVCLYFSVKPDGFFDPIKSNWH